MTLTALRDAFLPLSYKKYLSKCFSEGFELPYAAYVRNSRYICRRKQHFCAFLPYYEANIMTITARSHLSAPSFVFGSPPCYGWLHRPPVGAGSQHGALRTNYMKSTKSNCRIRTYESVSAVAAAPTGSKPTPQITNDTGASNLASLAASCGWPPIDREPFFRCFHALRTSKNRNSGNN